ncbi:hypothetical protein [Haloarcula salinisoli]|uniref:Uncharacterized protein n=1 Tax=Haloarcula salinisoli TaxID=2487746 RepID=A0A8J7YEG3_9EURY|nr:hypothetical protein [Halomicroarcula salinisoli]MBX0287631.1 hypothetical protein [Halomicroarcula salinisoli]MBX0304560.1 hypothetical protein [Halomicroarcula salinisoli]
MDSESVAWPSAEPSYRLRPPATDEAVALDALAAVLDATPRRPERVSVRLAIGRRMDLLGPRREALEALSGHADVTVADDHTIGTLALTEAAFADLAELFADLDRAVVFDPDGVAIADWRGGLLRFALPEAAVETVRDSVDVAIANRIERVE